MPMNTRRVDLSECNLYATQLWHRLADLGRGHIAGVVAVAKGGIWPALVVHQRLTVFGFTPGSVANFPGHGVQLVTTHKVGPDASGDHHIEVRGTEGIPDDGRGWVFIDDIYDSGATYRACVARWPRMLAWGALIGRSVPGCVLPEDVNETCARRFQRRVGQLDVPVIVGMPTPSNAWLVFPWEHDENS